MAQELHAFLGNAAAFPSNSAPQLTTRASAAASFDVAAFLVTQNADYSMSLWTLDANGTLSVQASLLAYDGWSGFEFNGNYYYNSYDYSTNEFSIAEVNEDGSTQYLGITSGGSSAALGTDFYLIGSGDSYGVGLYVIDQSGDLKFLAEAGTPSNYS